MAGKKVPREKNLPTPICAVLICTGSEGQTARLAPLPCFSQRGGLVRMLFTFRARRKENIPGVKGRGVHKVTGNFAN